MRPRFLCFTTYNLLSESQGGRTLRDAITYREVSNHRIVARLDISRSRRTKSVACPLLSDRVLLVWPEHSSGGIRETVLFRTRRHMRSTGIVHFEGGEALIRIELLRPPRDVLDRHCHQNFLTDPRNRRLNSRRDLKVRPWCRIPIAARYGRERSENNYEFPHHSSQKESTAS